MQSQVSVPLKQSQATETGGPQISIGVRRLRWRDLLALSRVTDRHMLNQPSSSRADSDPVRAGLRGLWPFTRDDQPIFIAFAEGDRRLMGFSQFKVVGPDQRWLMECVGVDVGVYEIDPIVEELTRHAVFAAGLNGVKRLYARIEAGSPVRTPLRRMGFTPYTREQVWAASVVPVTRPGRDVRAQEQSDVWSIHQLYMASTPRQVQYAEALTSHSWDVNVVLRSSGYGCRGWLVADEHLAVAYARAVSRHDAHVVDFMVVPEHREVLPHLLATVFTELSAMSARRVYVVVRDYQSECASVLMEHGFVLHLEQDAHVKYTTATTRSSVVAAAAYAVDGKEPVAKRVPTFLHGTPDPFQTLSQEERLRVMTPETIRFIEAGERSRAE
ncbi:MAG TPA: hypothetical protein VM450_11885 [Thermomicrobiales bacterium]|nr:hypothetical protein [Thermomicrobiales bacterium]